MDKKKKREGFIGQRMIALPLSTIYSIRQNPIINDFFVSQLGYYPNAKSHYRSRNNGANEHIFIYCTDGKGTIIIEDKTHTITKNQFFIIPKGIKHEYYANNNSPWSIYWMHLNGEKVDAICEKFFRSTNFDVTPDSRKVEEFSVIYDMLSHEPSQNEIELANIHTLHFISQFVYKSLNRQPNHIEQNSTIPSIINYIQQNLDRDLSINKISEDFSLEDNSLQTLFKKHTGYPIVRYINNRRIQKACEYLNYTNDSVKEIAYRCGFNDPLYFSRFFKKRMGKSPKQYRENLGIRE